MKRLLSAMALCASVCCPAPALAFVLGSDVVYGSSDYTSKWGSSVLGTGATVTWSVVGAGVDCSAAFNGATCSTTALSAFMPSDFETQIQAALTAWAAVANLRFVRVADDGAASGASTVSGDIRFGARSFTGTFMDGEAGFGFFPPSYFTPPGGSVYSLTPDSLTGEVFFNTDYGTAFAQTGYVFGVAAHETGHALGLAHTTVSGALMNPTLSVPGLGPQADDIAGMQFLYGVPVPSVPEPSMWALFGLGLAVVAARRSR